MKSLRSIGVATALVAVSSTFALYARQELQTVQEPQDQRDQIEQTPPRSADRPTRTYMVRMAAEPVARYRGPTRDSPERLQLAARSSIPTIPPS